MHVHWQGSNSLCVAPAINVAVCNIEQLELGPNNYHPMVRVLYDSAFIIDAKYRYTIHE